MQKLDIFGVRFRGWVFAIQRENSVHRLVCGRGVGGSCGWVEGVEEGTKG